MRGVGPGHTPDLSVVVVSWNTRALALDCLEALRRALSGSTLAVERLLVDNGSQDGTVAAVRRRAPDVRVLALPHNRGFAGGANAGLRAARGRHVLLLNSDARPLAGALERGVAHLDENDDVGLVGPTLLRSDGRRERTVHRPPRFAEELVPPALRPLLLRMPRQRARGPRDVDALRGAALFVRGGLWHEVGPLAEDYFFFLEETDWCARVRAAGYRVVQQPRARFVHASGASSKRRYPSQTHIEYHRSLYRFYRTHRGVRIERGVRALRLAKATVGLVVGAPLALGSPRARARWRVRRDLLAWHVRGRPDDAGLARVGASA